MHLLSRKLAWLAISVTGFAVAMTGLLLYFKYQGVLTGLQRERVGVVLWDVDNVVETSLALGQGFGDIFAMQDVIARRIRADAIIDRIDVLNADGTVTYTSTLAEMGSLSPVFAEIRGGNGDRQVQWLVRADHSLGVLPINNHYGVTVGHTIVRYSRVSEHRLVKDFLTRLVLACTGAFMFSASLLLIALIGIGKAAEVAHAASASRLANPTQSRTEDPLMQAIESRFNAVQAGLDRLSAVLSGRGG